MNLNYMNFFCVFVLMILVFVDDIKDGFCDIILYGNINCRYILSCKCFIFSLFFFVIEDIKILNRLGI